ncbi:hypothetical protein FGG08_000165 [Glutinoglossum americanum]|uniref:Nucleoside phosphorylase domain-containing protein n=1 Tax=Glutinoglossum americanum TaxID=1670608 RepID=A0A9P8IGV2_9PEZI|nr:hypothetical protein FGG08_000165 [Glutinoglossum americanum]
MADTMLDQKYEDLLVKAGDTNVYRHGRIGTVNVVISCLLEPPHAADAARTAQNMAATFIGIKAIVMIGFGSGVPNAGTRLGDLVISSAIIRYDRDAELNLTSIPNIAERAANVLQREIGQDGYWLSSSLYPAISKYPDLLQFSQRQNTCSDPSDYPQLHYRDIGLESQGIQSEELQDRLAPLKSIICFDDVAAGSREGDTWKRYAAANAVSYAKEIIQVMASNLMNSVRGLEGTEEIVPPPMDPRLPPFQPHQYPSHGNAVLLVIPTKNEFKRRVLQQAFRQRVPSDVVLHTLVVPVESDVGEQPYNEAGSTGAHNRISNALLRLDAVEYEETFRDRKIGIVIVACIESYIQTDNIDRPTDYGVVAIHNATTRQTEVCLSRGVTVPPAYVDRARRFGFEGDPNRGRVTVGQILAANAPGIDKADWQAVLARHSRYDLLKDALAQLPIPL